LGRKTQVIRAVIPLIFSVFVILFLYGYLSPYGLDPAKLLGPSYASLFGGTLSTLPGGGSMLTGTYAPLIPGGVTGLVIFTVMRRIGSVTRAATAPSMPSSSELMRMMNVPNLMQGMSASGGVPEALPADMSKSQFAILRSYRHGYKNPKEVSKALSMDRKDVDAQTSALVSKGYITKDNKLTSKALDILG
jgi:hypothetical protein